MTERNDNLNRELRWLDPVEPGELERAAGSADAADLLERIVSTEYESAPAPPAARRPRMAKLAWTAAGAVAVVAAVLIAVLGLSAGGGGEDDLAAALDQAATTAASQAPAARAQPYTYLKTREMSVGTDDSAAASVKVLESTIREEWVTEDGAGRLKIVDEPSRVIGSGEAAEVGTIDEASFSSLGFGRRTEDRFLDAGMLRGSVKELPTDPATLARRLRAKAQVEHGTTPVNAATLELIAEELRDPGASPRLRRALYEAAKRVPGIEYLGQVTDLAGRGGTAVGVTSSRSGAPIRYALIFDPGTSQVLATETTSRATLLRTRVYLRARGSESMLGNGGAWLSGFDPSASGPGPANLVYRIPDLGVS